MIMACCKCLVRFMQKCCGKRSSEFDTFANDNTSFQPTYTVRRISSFGHTVINENGEESEIGRHSSIITYNSEPVPWTSKPAPIQPGVTHSDIINHIGKLPTINENTNKTRMKHKKKKKEAISKKDVFPVIFKDHCCDEDILLKPLRKQAENKFVESNSISQDDIFSKCKMKLESFSNPKATLAVQNTTAKSVSSPDLVYCDDPEPSKNEKCLTVVSKSNLQTTLSTSNPTNKERKFIEAEKLAKEHGLDLSLYTHEALSPLNVSMKHPMPMTVSVWEEEPAGTLDISLNFNSLQKLLTIVINALHSLSGEGKGKEPFPTLIKLTLLSRKKVIKTSKKTMASLNPKIDQVFSFSVKDLDSRAVRFSVYNAEWLGKYDAVGHSFLPISDNLNSTPNLHLKLYSQSTLEKSVGMMQISFSYDGIVFNVRVDKIFNFEKKIGKQKLYTKITYYSLSKKIKEKTSPLVWGESKTEINFDFSTSFKIDSSGKNHSYILISLKCCGDQAMFKQDRTIGRIIMGPYFYSEGGKNLTPWGRAIIKKEKLCYCFKIVL